MAPGSGERRLALLKQHKKSLEWFAYHTLPGHRQSCRVKLPAIFAKVSREIAVKDCSKLGISVLKVRRYKPRQIFDYPCVDDRMRPGDTCWVQPKSCTSIVIHPIACPVAVEMVLQRIRYAQRATKTSAMHLVLAFAHWRVEVNNSKLLHLFYHCFKVGNAESQTMLLTSPDANAGKAVEISRLFHDFMGMYTAEAKVVSFDAYSVRYDGPDAVIGSPHCAQHETNRRNRANQNCRLGSMLFPVAKIVLQALGEFLGNELHWQLVIRSAFPLVSLNMRHIFGISAKAVIMGGGGASGVWVMPEEGTTVVRRSYRLVFLYEQAEHGSQES